MSSPIELVLRSERAGDSVELAAVDGFVVSLGFTEGIARPWARIARALGDDSPEVAIARIVEYWSARFPKRAAEPAPRARAAAEELLGAGAPLWTLYARGDLGARPERRIVETDGFCAIETLVGKNRKLTRVDAPFAEVVRTKLMADAIGVDVQIATAAELETIAALPPPKRAARGKPARKPPAATATFAQRVEHAFATLAREGLLALRGRRSTQSAGWEDVHEKRSAEHTGAVFYLASHLADQRDAAAPRLPLYWCAFPPASEAAVGAQIALAMRAAGLDADEPASADAAIFACARA